MFEKTRVNKTRLADVLFWVAIDFAWEKADKYYKLIDKSDVYSVSIALDLRLKYNYFTHN
jgi:hypothetical protein